MQKDTGYLLEGAWQNMNDLEEIIAHNG